jgi:NAD(P)-dependent dehydrogenase (short-subunit alcohol dehydrogenase family)
MDILQGSNGMMIPESLELGGKVAIVTGGGALDEGIGNGRAAAILLAKAGASVLVVDRKVEPADRTVSMIQDVGGNAMAFVADVTNETECESAVQAAMDTWGRLDILDNNVGIGSRGSVVEESLDNWRLVMQVNIDSMFLMSKYAVPAMMASADGGAIVNVSSISAIMPRGLTAYTTSKGAVISLTKAMAVDHGADGIRVNCVLPGPVYTPMVYGRGMSEAARETRRKSALLPVEGSGWDVGQTVLYLCSPMSRFMTGQALIVDGGVTLKGPPRDTQ